MTLLHEDIPNNILAGCFEVCKELGSGFLEPVYKNALIIVLHDKGLSIKSEVPLPVMFRGKIIGQFFADILVEEKIILELKAVNELTNVHKAQLINYLKAANLEIGLLINFGNPKLEYRRFDNRLKQTIILENK